MLPSPSLEGPSLRQDTLSETLSQAVALSLPLYTWKELKSLLRCAYHTHVMQLRDGKTWDEVSLLTGMTRAGINKLGDEVPPRRAGNAMRALALVLQRAEDGLRLPELAAAYFAAVDDLDDAPSLREALVCLTEAGVVEEREGGTTRPASRC